MSEGTSPRWKIDGLDVIGPTREPGGTWSVRALDSVLEEVVAEKRFGSEDKARAWLLTLATGKDAEHALAEGQGPHDKLGTFPPSVFDGSKPNPPTLNGRHTRSNTWKGAKDADAAPFNLRAVADVLQDYELDPIAELAQVIMNEEPLRKRDGTTVVDPETGKPVMTKQIHGIDRAKVLIELAQYVTPKLKAVEVKVEDKRALPADEIDRRIAALMAKQQPKT
jgi:hypothetical protein